VVFTYAATSTPSRGGGVARRLTSDAASRCSPVLARRTSIAFTASTMEHEVYLMPAEGGIRSA